MKLPDASEFPIWEDTTDYTRQIHVARAHPAADDANDGSPDSPLATVSRAAQLAEPGTRVIIHEGIYREHIVPARAGQGPDAMICYCAADGQEPVLCGSRVYDGPFAASQGFRLKGSARVWMFDIPAGWFVGYQPFIADNLTPYYRTFNDDWTTPETHRLQLKRGGVYVDGRRLRQVLRVSDLAETEDAFCVEAPGTRIHLRLAGDADPAGRQIELTVREQVFAPEARGLGYIRLSGLTFRHAADGVPVPQRAMVSAVRGHHWIIENCRLSECNVGIDLGKQTWEAPRHSPCGGHIVRNNHIHDCGVCGIAGVDCVDDTLVEGNCIERIGWRQIERIWECAGLKMHHARGVLIRGNVFRHICQASGVWLDIGNENCRITGNCFADIETYLGACFIECTHFQNVVDGNVFCDIRDIRVNRATDPNHNPGGVAVKTDSGEYLTVAHNLFLDVPDNYAVGLSLAQNQRIVQGRTGLCRRNGVWNNLFVATPKRILLGMTEENQCDGNLFDASNDRASLSIESPAPQTHVDLQAWQEFYGYDCAGAQRTVSAELEVQAGALRLGLEGDWPEPVEVPIDLSGATYATAGPFSAGQIETLGRGEAIEIPCLHETEKETR